MSGGSFARLVDLMESIKKELSAIAAAERLPQQWEMLFPKLRYSLDGWGSSPPPPEMVQALHRAGKADLRREAQDQRLREISAHAATIERLRVLLPAAAADACIEVGSSARAALAKARGEA